MNHIRAWLAALIAAFTPQSVVDRRRRQQRARLDAVRIAAKERL